MKHIPIFLVGGGKFTAFHMPLFFIISGYFLNPDKIKNTNIGLYIMDKFKHLMIPSIVWTFFYCLAIPSAIHPFVFITNYWYLSGLFLSFIVIAFFCKLLKNINLIIILSTTIILLMPFTNVVNINFMFPFLWIGYLLRVFTPKYDTVCFIVALVISVALYSIWNYDYSVYLAPFNILAISSDMVVKYIIRFSIGVSTSYCIIWLVRHFETSKVVSCLSKYGENTLLVYLVSILFCRIMMHYIHIGITTPVLLDILSLLITIALYIVCVALQKVFMKVRYTKLLFLGITK